MSLYSPLLKYMEIEKRLIINIWSDRLFKFQPSPSILLVETHTYLIKIFHNKKEFIVFDITVKIFNYHPTTSRYKET